MVAASRLDDTHDTGGAERVFLALRDRVVSGELKAGDRLPPERELALKFNVSRPLLREALRSLAMLGFLEIIQGSGAYVRQPDIALVSDFLTFCMAQQPDVLDDIIMRGCREFRPRPSELDRSAVVAGADQEEDAVLPREPVQQPSQRTHRPVEGPIGDSNREVDHRHVGGGRWL